MCNGQCKFQTNGEYTHCLACGFSGSTASFQAEFEENENPNFNYQNWANHEDENRHWKHEQYRPVRQTNSTGKPENKRQES